MEKGQDEIYSRVDVPLELVEISRKKPVEPTQTRREPEQRPVYKGKVGRGTAKSIPKRGYGKYIFFSVVFVMLVIMIYAYIQNGISHAVSTDSKKLNDAYAADQVHEQQIRATLARLIPNLTHATVVKEDPKRSEYSLDIAIGKEPYFGSKADWSGVASETHDLAKSLFDDRSISKVSLNYYSSESHNEWAIVAIDRAALPENWRDLSFHQFIGLTETTASPDKSLQWMCGYYYENKNMLPSGNLPEACKNYTPPITKPGRVSVVPRGDVAPRGNAE